MKYYITSAGNPTILDERIENLLDMKDWKEISEKEYKKFQDNNKAIHTQDSVDSALKLEEAIADAKKAGWSDEMIEAGFGRKI